MERHHWETKVLKYAKRFKKIAKNLKCFSSHWILVDWNFVCSKGALQWSISCWDEEILAVAGAQRQANLLKYMTLQLLSRSGDLAERQELPKHCLKLRIGGWRTSVVHFPIEILIWSKWPGVCVIYLGSEWGKKLAVILQRRVGCTVLICVWRLQCLYGLFD